MGSPRSGRALLSLIVGDARNVRILNEGPESGERLHTNRCDSDRHCDHGALTWSCSFLQGGSDGAEVSRLVHLAACDEQHWSAAREGAMARAAMKKYDPRYVLTPGPNARPRDLRRGRPLIFLVAKR